MVSDQAPGHTMRMNAGILDKGELKVLDNGVIQGSIVSPLLANVFSITSWTRSYSGGEQHLQKAKYTLYATQMTI